MKITKEKLFRKKDITTILLEVNQENGGLKRNLTATSLVVLGIGAIVGQALPSSTWVRLIL